MVRPRRNPCGREAPNAELAGTDELPPSCSLLPARDFAAAPPRPRLLFRLKKIGERAGGVGSDGDNVRGVVFDKMQCPEIPSATVARPRQIMRLAWLTLDRPCAAAKDEGPG